MIEGLNASNAIWDDGEWISWDEINAQLEEQEHQARPWERDPEACRVFDDLLRAAIDYHDLTGRYLQIWGELGEFYAEIEYGIKRHRPHVPGSDGRLGDDFVEIKTISPEKGGNEVRVKWSGNFSKLLIVRIAIDWTIESRLIDRSSIRKGSGKHAKVNWDDTAGPASRG